MPIVTEPAASGGFNAVGCLLAVHSGSITLAGAGNGVFITYDRIYDNVNDMNQLGAFPAGLGFDPLTFGTDTLVTTVAGVWSLSLGDIAFPPDTTWTGEIEFGHFNFGGPSWFSMPTKNAGTGNLQEVSLSQTLNLPIGAGLAIGLNTFDGATASPYHAQPGTLAIVRLA